MNKIINLRNMAHADTCSKQLVFEKELDSNLSIWKPVTKWNNGDDAPIRIGYDNDDVIEFIDFDGGPMIYIGTRIENKYTVHSFVHDGKFNNIGVILKDELHI